MLGEITTFVFDSCANIMFYRWQLCVFDFMTACLEQNKKDQMFSFFLLICPLNQKHLDFVFFLATLVCMQYS